MCKLNKFKLLSSIFGLLVSTIAGFGQVNFTSSNLPIVVINTNGQTIPDEPKITVNMGIIWNENGQRNFLSDPFNHYDGLIGIEIRGSSSQMFPKKQYGFETRDADGEDLDVELLGMPEESDWILHAPYSDKSLMRNVLAYDFANRMGRYASRTHYCELVLNGEYMGVYILMEKIKRDDNRVNIKKLDEDEISGVDLTGGYIIKIDKPDVPGTGGWYSPFRPYENAPQMINYLYETPDAEDIVPEQVAYIQNFIYEIEGLFYAGDYRHPFNGYYERIDVGSFIDFLLINEISRNVDGYRISTFMYKDREDVDNRWVMGPVWDFNLGFGNANYYSGSAISGWQFNFQDANDPWQIPFYWDKLLADPVFTNLLTRRWNELRNTIFHSDSLMSRVEMFADSIEEARIRNFVRWPILGVWVWPNEFVGPDYQSELNYLKLWISARVNWMDSQIGTNFTTVDWASAEDVSPTSVDGETISLLLSDVAPVTDNLDSIVAVSESAELTAVVDNGQLLLNATAEGYFHFRLLAKRNGETVGISPLYTLRALISSIEDSPGSTPKTFKLNQNFPNPFNGTTNIFYYLPKVVNVRLTLFNTTGELVQVLHSGAREAGWHSAIWNGLDRNGNSASSGVYFYRLEYQTSVASQSNQQTKKLLLIQ